MPPEGYASVSLPQSLLGKLSRIIVATEADSYRDAIEVAVDAYLEEQS
jgi:metal-responsive CopG/Arc/MetJ family transcriptional regulator